MSPKVGSELAQQLGLMYFECSAKTFQGVDNPFYYLVTFKKNFIKIINNLFDLGSSIQHVYLLGFLKDT